MCIILEKLVTTSSNTPSHMPMGCLRGAGDVEASNWLACYLNEKLKFIRECNWEMFIIEFSFFLFLGESEEISQPKKQGSLPAMAMCWI